MKVKQLVLLQEDSYDHKKNKVIIYNYLVNKILNTNMMSNYKI